MIVPTEHSDQPLGVEQSLHKGHILAVICKHRLGGSLARLDALLRKGHVLVDAWLLVRVDVLVLKREECVDGDVYEGEDGEGAVEGCGEVIAGLDEPSYDVWAYPVWLTDGETGGGRFLVVVAGSYVRPFCFSC